MWALIALALCSLSQQITGVTVQLTPCPYYCTCTQTSYSGSSARCSQIDPRLEKIPSDTVHLTLEQYQEERLVDGIFADLGLLNLRTISITNGTLRHINPGAFKNLLALETLDVSNNKLEGLDPHTFETNVVLKKLNLRGNPISLYNHHLPKHLQIFLFSKSLMELSLSNTNVQTLEDVQSLSNLGRLEYLDLSHNKLTELKDDMFTNLINLETLDLSFNKIRRIDRDTFADIDDLGTLILRGNPIKTLEGLEIPGLKELDISQCHFEMLSASSFDGFGDLYSLNLSSNTIRTIDMDTFVSVPNLNYLDLSYNKLRGPFNSLLFEYNKKLETLSFRGNTEIKDMLGFEGEFPYLYKYDISKCGLSSITDHTFKGMFNLDTLNVSGNSLFHIDSKTFSSLDKLTILDLSKNLLHTLPNDLFSSNKKLFRLDLSHNYFKHFSPLLFLPLVNLHTLDVSKCSLVSLWNISESFTMRDSNILNKLSYLNLAGNKLTRLHKHYFVSMSKLEKLDISKNPIECTPDFSHVMQWLIMNRVTPNNGNDDRPIPLDLIQNNVQWDDILRAVCPLDISYNNNNNRLEDSHDNIIQVPNLNMGEEILPSNEVFPLTEEPSLVWPMVLIWISIFSILFALVNLIALLVYRSKRNYKILSYPRPTFSLDGQFQIRRGNGRSLYQKLYEECSVPAPVHETGKKVRIVAILGNALTKNNAQV